MPGKPGETGIRVLALYGSPRAGGNTDTMLDSFLAGASGNGTFVERVYIRSLSIAPCAECGACGENGECTVQDDMLGLYPKLLSYERVVFSLPVFFLGPPAASKALIDRGQALWIRRYALGRRPGPDRMGFLVSAGGFANERVFMCNRRIVRAFYAACGVKYAGDLVRPGLDEPDAAAAAQGLREELFRAGRGFVNGPV